MPDHTGPSLSRLTAVALAGVLLFAPTSATIAAQSISTTSPAQGLRIVILEGEDAVNIIQQRTAVAPVVEVRDRNDQPVAGAVVRFAIRAGRGSFSGARTLTVTTNTAGRAVAAGFTPSGSGVMQIGATATFQGQTAAVTIAQTNVLTAAQAASAASGAGGGGAGAGAGGGSAAGGGAGGAGAAGAGAAGAGATAAGAAAAGAGAAAGGGIGLTTIGIVGAAAAGGTYAAAKVVSKASSGGSQLKGSYTAQLAVVYRPNSGSGGGCTRTFSLQGALTFDYGDNGGTIQGDFDHETDETVVATTCGGDPVGTTMHTGYSLRVTGAAASLSGSGSRTSSPLTGVTVTDTFQFNGSLAGGVLTGTFTQSETIASALDTGTGTAAASVTLR